MADKMKIEREATKRRKLEDYETEKRLKQEV